MILMIALLACVFVRDLHTYICTYINFGLVSSPIPRFSMLSLLKTIEKLGMHWPSVCPGLQPPMLQWPSNGLEIRSIVT